MSAKKLEEFIGLIETAERLASKEVAAEGNGRSTSSLWSYPTDIFTPSRKAVNTGSSRSPSISPLRGRKTIDNRRPNTAAYPQVPKLWEPKHAAEWLGSSWGSGASSTVAKAKHEANGSSAITNKSQNTPDTGTSTNEGHVNGSPVTVRHVTSKGEGKNAIKAISNDRTRKGSSSVSSTDQERMKQKSSRPVLTKQESVASRHRIELMDMQKQSLFKRVVARELSPAAPPTYSGNDTNKSKKQFSARNVMKGSTPTSSPQKLPIPMNGKNVGSNAAMSPSNNGPEKRDRRKGKMSITDDSGGEDNKPKVADTSSRRNSPLTSTTPSQENNYSKSTRQSSTDAKDISDTTSPGSSASSMTRKSRLKRSPTMQSNKDVPTSTSKLNTTSRTDASISPPRSTPPKPLSRVKMKKPTLHEDNLEEFEGEDSEDYTNEAFYNSRKNAPKDSGQNSRTSMTGLDPRRIEQHMKMKRPSSAPMKELAEKENMRPLSTQEIDSSVDLRSYSKSLKLLGLDIPSNRREANKLENIDVEVRTSSPTMRTRLVKRTTSYSDLRTKMAPTSDDTTAPDERKHRIPKEEYQDIKSNLCEAVFEEWYFKKLDYDVKKKQTEQAKEEARLYNEEMEKLEKKENAAIEYEKWLRQKKEQYIKATRRKIRRDASKEKDSEEKQERIRKAELEWKEKKIKERRQAQKRLQKKAKKEIEEEKKKIEKRSESSKTFQSWQESIDDRAKARREEERQRKLQEKQKIVEEEKEKRENAEAAFKAWTEKKNIIEKERRARKKKSTNKMEDKKIDNDIEAKLAEASKAYEDWLTSVEQREEEEKLAEEERLTRELWRPPWYPPGVADV